MTDRDGDWLVRRFEEQRPRLRGVAYRMLGSTGDAEDAVQEAWLRVARADADAVDNLDAWLTTVVARVSLNMLRARRSRPTDPLDVRVPDPVVEPAEGPEAEAVLADSVGLALLVVLETLSPAERVAFVMSDVLAVPFAEIGVLLDRTPEAARQLASRARRRVRAAGPQPDAGLRAQREVVDAFFAAGRDGDFARLVTLLHPGVVLRADFGPSGLRRRTEGAEQVAGQALFFAKVGREPVPVTVNGLAGVVITEAGVPVAVGGFTVSGARIVAIDMMGDPDRLPALELERYVVG